jgi:hypothetical protein
VRSRRADLVPNHYLFPPRSSGNTIQPDVEVPLQPFVPQRFFSPPASAARNFFFIKLPADPASFCLWLAIEQLLSLSNRVYLQLQLLASPRTCSAAMPSSSNRKRRRSAVNESPHGIDAAPRLKRGRGYAGRRVIVDGRRASICVTHLLICVHF